MRREAVDCVDRGANGYVVSQDIDMTLAVDNPPRECTGGSIADKDDARIFFPEVMAQMVQDSSACAHARTGHDHRTALEVVDLYRIEAISHQFEAGGLERVLSLGQKIRAGCVVRFRMVAVDFRG